MKKYKKIIISTFLSFILGIAIFYYFGHYVGWDIFKEVFSGFNLYYLATILIVTFAIIIVGSWRFKEIVCNDEEKISFYHIFKIYLGGYSIMYLFPIAILSGEMFRVYGLVKKDIKLEKAISFVLIERIVEWTFNALFILLGVIIFYFKFNFLSSHAISIFGLLLFVLLLFLFIFYLNVAKRSSIVSYIIEVVLKKEVSDTNAFLKIENNIYSYFNYKNHSLYKSILLSFLKIFLMQLRLVILIIFLSGTIIPLFYTFPILGFAQLSSMIPIPAGLGTYEFSQLFVFNNMGLNYSIAISVSMIIRLAEIIVCFLGIFYIIKAGFNIFKISENNK